MKRNTIIATIIMVFSLGFSAKAQVLSGTNLNIGDNNVITGTSNAASAIGSHIRVNTNFSLAIGYGDTLTYEGGNSLVVGGANKMSGASSISVGLNNQVFSNYSIGFGRYVKTSAEQGCMAIGVGLYGTATRPALYMENQYDNSLMIGFLSIKPTFTISPAYTDYFSNGSIFDRTGKIAIGDVPMPDIAAKLHIRSDMEEDAGIILEPKDPENNSTFIRMRDEGHGIEVDNTGQMTLQSMNGDELGSLILQGRIGINIANESDSYVLAVNGGILTDEVFIKNVDEWYDNVFTHDYKLLSLSDLSRYINQHGHLPEVPSEAEVLEQGYDMATMQGLLLKKIEELTLYTLEQQERIEKLEQRILELEGK